MTHRTEAPPWRRAGVALVALGLAAVLASPATGGSAPSAPTDQTTARLATLAQAQTAAQAQRPAAAKPTIVLVHGAFADASGWNDVIIRLQKRGYTVLAPPNPLRGLTSDAAYLAAFLATVPGPIVLVGHSYGGAVITNAARENPNVEALVYVAAYALAEGETVAAANELGGGSTDLLDHVIIRPFPGAAEGDADVYVEPRAFRRIFAQDLPRRLTAAMAAGQRPGAFAALITPSGAPAWADVPSWYLVSADDNLIPPQAQRAMARRAGARTSEVDSSHVSMMSHPRRVTRLIVTADRRS